MHFALLKLRLTRHIQPTRLKRLDALLSGVKFVPPNTAIIIAQQMQRHRSHRRARRHLVNVIVGQQFVEIAGLQVIALLHGQLGVAVNRAIILAAKHLFVL